MAANKRKILESARKLAQKGAKEKALAEYQKLLRMDPKDAKLRLEIGDAYRRWGQVEQAVDTYVRVADQYMGEGFDARAVAVYKQILNLAPDRFESYTPLAELYERMGLTAEAIAALQTAADGLHRQGKRSEALEVLRKMANVDPTNTNSRIKVADLLRQEGKTQDAIYEYRLAAEELERQGDTETVGTLYRRILEIDEMNVFALGALASSLASRGKVAESIPLAERALQLDDGNADRYEQLAELYARAERPPEREGVLRRLAELYRARGDEDRARDIVQRFSSSLDLSQGDAPHDDDELSGVGLLEGSEDGFFGDDFPDNSGDAPEFAVDFGNDAPIDSDSSLGGSSQPLDSPPPGESDPRLLFDEDDLEVGDPAPPAPAPSAPEADFDAEQLLAEASVYLRYGKREKAIAHLERVTTVEPHHRGALEKLGEAFAEEGDHERAVEMWLRAAKRAREEGDDEALRVLRSRIAVLDEAAAAELGPAAGPGEPAAVAPSPAGIDLAAEAGGSDELLLEDEYLEDDVDGGDSAPDEMAVAAGSEGFEIDIDVDVDVDVDVDAEVGAGDASRERAAEPELGFGDEVPSGPGVSLRDIASESHNDASLSATARQQVLDDLEEADFYMQQGLHSEAEGIYQRVLAVAPNHPRALLRLGEIAAARGAAPQPEPPSRPRTPALEETPVPAIDVDDDGDLLGSDPSQDATPDEIEIQVDLGDADLGEDGLVDDGLGDTGADLSADTGMEDLSDLASEGETTETEAPEESTIDGSDTQELRLQREAAAARPREPEPLPAMASPDDSFDLAAALADAFEDEQGSSAPALGSGDEGFEAVFDAFKRGVRETLSDGDHQAHYDLAIAYKEMGLLDDAIDELRTAMADPGRTAECLHLIGLCAIDADQAPLAIEHLEQLLTLPDLDPDAKLAARFDLGRALELVGDLEGVRREWEAVAASRPDFQDVSERLTSLGEAKPDDTDADTGSEGFESFDDVMAGMDDDEDDGETPSEPETIVGGESFDDLVAEANAGDDEALAAPEFEPEEEPDPEPAAPSRPSAKRPSGPPKPSGRAKKKKISFF